MALDEIELWINERYGRIWHQSVITPLVEIHSAVVPTFASVAIGMGPTRQLAIHDLYEELNSRPELVTGLTGFWRERRDALNGVIKPKAKTWEYDPL